MDESHDIEHASAECFFQHQYFRDIIISEREDANIYVYNTYKNKIDNLNKYDAFLWTGGLGSIYENNSHNKNQIEICEKILKLDKPLWGSCWGLQVVAYCYGDVIKKSKKPEFGYSEKIEIIKNHKSYKDKINYFTAPGHHYDHLESINSEFEIISQNNLSIQSISHKSKNIFCTQYHPELPYNFIGSLMKYWKKNYLKIMDELNFNNLLNKLEILEKEDKYNRKLEIENWLRDLN